MKKGKSISSTYSLVTLTTISEMATKRASKDSTPSTSCNLSDTAKRFLASFPVPSQETKTVDGEEVVVFNGFKKEEKKVNTPTEARNSRRYMLDENVYLYGVEKVWEGINNTGHAYKTKRKYVIFERVYDGKKTYTFSISKDSIDVIIMTLMSLKDEMKDEEKK